MYFRNGQISFWEGGNAFKFFVRKGENPLQTLLSKFLPLKYFLISNLEVRSALKSPSIGEKSNVSSPNFKALYNFFPVGVLKAEYFATREK